MRTNGRRFGFNAPDEDFACKGKPIPSDHAPLVIDLDQPGHLFDAGWEAAEARIAARLR